MRGVRHSRLRFWAFVVAFYGGMCFCGIRFAFVHSFNLSQRHGPCRMFLCRASWGVAWDVSSVHSRLLDCAFVFSAFINKYILRMNIGQRILFAISLISVSAFAAGGAASVVAKTANKSFSEPTRSEFLSNCGKDVEAPICNCVLKKLEANYDESTYKSLEAKLAKGEENPEYVGFIVGATTQCGDAFDSAEFSKALRSSKDDANESSLAPKTAGGVNVAGFQVSADDMMIFMALLQTPMFKDSFVKSCSVEAMDWLGVNQADKSCKCAYGRLIKDNTLLTKLVNQNGSDGEIADFDKWGYALIEPCLPTQYLPEMENAFVKECMKAGDVSKNSCDCVLKSVKKKYSVRSLIKIAFEDPKRLEMEMTLKMAQCLSN